MPRLLNQSVIARERYEHFLNSLGLLTRWPTILAISGYVDDQHLTTICSGRSAIVLLRRSHICRHLGGRSYAS